MKISTIVFAPQSLSTCLDNLTRLHGFYSEPCRWTSNLRSPLHALELPTVHFHPDALQHLRSIVSLKSPSIPSRLPKLSTTTTLFHPYFASLSLSSPNGKPTLLPFIIHNHWSLCLINATFQTSHSEPLKVCWVLTLLCPLHTTPHTASRVGFLTDEMHIIPLLKNSLCSFRIEYKPQITYMALHIRGSSHTHHSAILQILSILLPCLPLPRITS